MTARDGDVAARVAAIEAAPISSPRCDAWRAAVDGDPYPSTEVRCAFAAGHPMPHARYGITWTDEESPA